MPTTVIVDDLATLGDAMQIGRIFFVLHVVNPLNTVAVASTFVSKLRSCK